MLFSAGFEKDRPSWQASGFHGSELLSGRSKPFARPQQATGSGELDGPAPEYLSLHLARGFEDLQQIGATPTAIVVYTAIWRTSRRLNFGPAYGVPLTAASSNFHRPSLSRLGLVLTLSPSQSGGS